MDVKEFENNCNFNDLATMPGLYLNLADKEPTRRKLIRKIANFLLKNSSFGFSKTLLFFARLILPKYEQPAVIQTNYGFKMIIDLKKDEPVGSNIYYLGYHEPEALKIMNKCLRNGDICVDACANIGLLSLYASGLVGEKGLVYSFEPELAQFDNLQKNIFINSSKNVRPYEHGVFEISNFFEEKGIEKIQMLCIKENDKLQDILTGADKILRTENAPAIYIKSDKKIKDAYNFFNYITHYKLYKFVNTIGNTLKLKKVLSIKDLTNCSSLVCITDKHFNRLPYSIFY